MHLLILKVRKVSGLVGSLIGVARIVVFLYADLATRMSIEMPGSAIQFDFKFIWPSQDVQHFLRMNDIVFPSTHPEGDSDCKYSIAP